MRAEHEAFPAQLGEARAKAKRYKARFKSRESRREDVVRINELTQLLERANAAARKAREEMQFFKLELVNREESYNKNFGSSPAVGVMNVLRPAGQSKSKRPPRKKAPGRTASPSTAASGSARNAVLMRGGRNPAEP
jgi:hypothetical protein